LAVRLRVPSINSSLKRLAACGFEPQGVFDVGAFRGDFAKEALQIWPKTHVTCFEPQAYRAEDFEKLCHKYPNQVDYQKCLVGATPREAVTFYVGGSASSVLPHTSADQYPTIQLPMTTLDTFRAEANRGSCSLLKLDVQGYELDVLRGSEQTLRSDVEVILAELNFLDIYDHVPLVHETLAWLSERDFVAYDISSLIRRPLDDALWQADFIFTKRMSPLRQNKTWS
jgi:FkbM family methyltransferase